jgi:acetylornithine deacetylase/succinyl-diaminopimelate desuccinylase-like protein
VQPSTLPQQVDQQYLLDTLFSLLRVPTDVPLGSNTHLSSDDPKLVHYVQGVLRPEIERLGVYDLLDAGRNNLVARLGRGTSCRSHLLQFYTVTQHHNLMPDPFNPRIGNAREWGYDEPCVFGQGVSQNKAHHAIVLALLKLLRDEHVDLDGRLYVAINNEGLSSHTCTQAIMDALGDEKPEAAVLLTKTWMGIQLGNRGRVDAIVTVRGKPTHSSAPQNGLSAIDGANEVINRVRAMRFDEKHPDLGGRHAVVYQVTYSPLAPHTLPGTARLVVDRRLLPGDDPDQAVDEVRAAIGDMQPYDVTVERGTFMLPAHVAPDAPVARMVADAYRKALGKEPRLFYGSGTFDAGGPISLGVPAVMFGASAGDFPLGVDFTPLSAIWDEAKVVTRLVADTLIG